MPIPMSSASGGMGKKELSANASTNSHSGACGDAISPIVTTDSVNMDIAWKASRYDKGGADYLNLPLDEEQYHSFIKELLAVEVFPYRDFETANVFEGCMPIEEMASRGPETLAHGPMKPVGLIDPKTGERPHAVVQLRAENERLRLEAENQRLREQTEQ